MNVKPQHQSIILPANTEAELKAIDVCETALHRQIGWRPKFDLYKDDKGKVWGVAGWRMTRGEQAAVAMFQRRGKEAKDTKPGDELLKAKDVEKKHKADVIKDKGPTTAAAVPKQK